MIVIFKILFKHFSFNFFLSFFDLCGATVFSYSGVNFTSGTIRSVYEVFENKLCIVPNILRWMLTRKEERGKCRKWPRYIF